jgi:hypothetical protein
MQDIKMPIDKLMKLGWHVYVRRVEMDFIKLPSWTICGKFGARSWSSIGCVPTGCRRFMILQRIYAFKPISMWYMFGMANQPGFRTISIAVSLCWPDP